MTASSLHPYIPNGENMAQDIRPDWDSYFMRIAAEVALRSTCTRANVGAVVTKDRRILTTGWLLTTPTRSGGVH